MGTIYLVITVVMDVVGIALLDRAKGFTNIGSLIGGLVCMIIGFIAFSYATKTLPVGIANAIWAAASVVLVIIVGVIFMDQKLSLLQYGFLAFVVIGVVGLQLVGGETTS